MYEQARCHGEAVNHQLPIAVAFWIIQIVSAEELLRKFKLNTKFDADLLPYLLIHF